MTSAGSIRALKPGERRRVITGHSRQDGSRLHARSADRRVPLGEADHRAERRRRHRRRDRRGDRQSRNGIHGVGSAALCLSEPQRRQELAGGGVQPIDQRHVLPAAEHLHDRDRADRQARRSPHVRLRQQEPDYDRAPTRWARFTRSRRRPGRRSGSTSSARRTQSLVATGGRLLFGGDAHGRFRAFDQDTGKVLWEVNLGSQVTGYPIPYAVDGRQYIAVSTGGSLATGGTNALTPELRSGTANNLFVFALPTN